MERVVYEKMAELDERHWWYCARRDILAALIGRLVEPPANAQILEIGCGTGHNLAMLQRFGRVDALELDDQARAVAEKRLGKPIMSAPLPGLKGVPEGHYDLVGAFDVIEHIDDDAAAIASIARRLKPGGRFMMTVPAHRWMWSAHDEVNHHKRRYSKAALRQLLEQSPLKLERVGYFNSLLFPLAITRRLSPLRERKSDELSLPPAPLNAALRTAFAAERHLVGRLPFPPGLSLFAVASAT